MTRIELKVRKPITLVPPSGAPIYVTYARPHRSGYGLGLSARLCFDAPRSVPIRRLELAPTSTRRFNPAQAEEYTTLSLGRTPGESIEIQLGPPHVRLTCLEVNPRWVVLNFALPDGFTVHQGVMRGGKLCVA